jgi:hypothetical protein
MSCYPAPAPVDDFVLLFSPPCSPHLTPLATGSLESGLLVSPLLRGPARHRPFARHSSPAQTQIKPQPAPALLDQESVHTMLSITHHSQERPSTGPRTLLSSTRTDVVATLAATSTSATASVRSESFDVALATIVSTPPGRRSSDHGARRT